MKRTLLLLVTLLCGLLIQPGAAQVGHTAPSVEWLTAAADRAVRATVRDVEFRYSVLKAWEVPVRNPPRRERLEEYVPPPT